MICLEKALLAQVNGAFYLLLKRRKRVNQKPYILRKNIELNFMIDKPVNGNIYEVGTLIKAKANPGVDLVIHSYLQRIYFCAELGNPDGGHFAYFEGELIPPSSEVQRNPFMRMADKKDTLTLL